jgi:hypothetical protein
MSSTSLVNTCRHLKLNIFMPFDKFFTTSKNTHHLAFSLARGKIPNFGDFSNANYVFDLNDWTSTTTNIFHLGSTHISWCCWKQNSISLLSCECEYWSLANYCCEYVWIHRLLHELGLNMSAQSCVTIRAPLNFLRT